MIERDLLLQKVSVLALKQEWRGDERGRKRKLLGRGGKGGVRGWGARRWSFEFSSFHWRGGMALAARRCSPFSPHPPTFTPQKKNVTDLLYFDRIEPIMLWNEKKVFCET